MGRTCYCCKKPKGECITCLSWPPEIKQPTKSKIIISGFQDYNFDNTYSEDFYNGAPFTNRVDIGWSNEEIVYRSGSVFQGHASVRYVINISGLSQLNTVAEFEKDGQFFIPKEQSRFLGEITATSYVETTISGKGYAFMPESCADFISCGFGNNNACFAATCDPLEPCVFQPPWTDWPAGLICPYGPPNPKQFASSMNCLHETYIPSNWGGKIGTKSKYDVYLAMEKYSCSGYDFDDYKNHRIFTAIGRAPMLRFVIILKETEIIEEGIYKDIGWYYNRESFDQCYQAKTPDGNLFTPIGCPVDDQQPCEKIVVKHNKLCRNSLYAYKTINNVSNHSLVRDVVEKIYHGPCIGGRCTQNCFCENLSKPEYCSSPAYKYWKKCRYFINYLNFSPFGNFIHMLNIDTINIDPFKLQSCDLSSFNNLTANYAIYFDQKKLSNGFPLSCYDNQDAPNNFCNSYNDFDKTIKQKYTVTANPSMPTNYAIFNDIEDNTINVINKTNYLKILNQCDAIYNASSCDFSSADGIGISHKIRLASSSSSSGLDILNYVLSGNFRHLDFYVDSSTTVVIPPNSNSKCATYGVKIPPPLFKNMFTSVGWGNVEIEFLKNQDTAFRYWSCITPINYCHKTFANHPELPWSQVGKQDGQIIIGIKTKKVTPPSKEPIFYLPKPPKITLEAIYE